MGDTQEGDQLKLMIIAATLSKKYDEWSKYPNTLDVLNVNTNEICICLKEKYPEIEDSVAQSISLAYILYLYTLILQIPMQLSNIDVD